MKIIYPPYVLKRMIERNLTVADVRDVLENGELIEEYKADVPPRYLLLGWRGDRPFTWSEKMTCQQVRRPW